MSQADTGFKQARCQAIIRVCEGQTAEKANYVLAFQGQKERQRQMARRLSMSFYENKEAIGASASMPPPRASVSASVVDRA
eukprot:6470774-Amphidinium_carterae.2